MMECVQVSLRSHKELVVWKKGMQIVEEIYRLVRALPDVERYGLKSQMLRAAVSIPSNIAEGYGRSHRGEYLYHLSVAAGSVRELETLLEIARRVKYLEENSTKLSEELIEEEGRMLSRLIQSLHINPGRRL